MFGISVSYQDPFYYLPDSVLNYFFTRVSFSRQWKSLKYALNETEWEKETMLK